MQPTTKKPGLDSGPKLHDRHAAMPPDSNRILDNLARGGHSSPSSALAARLRWRPAGLRHARPGWRSALAAALCLLAGGAAWIGQHNNGASGAGKRDLPVTVITPASQAPPHASADPTTARAAAAPATHPAATIIDEAPPPPPRRPAAATAAALAAATPASSAAASAPTPDGGHAAAASNTMQAAPPPTKRAVNTASAAPPLKKRQESAGRNTSVASVRRQTAAPKSRAAPAAVTRAPAPDTDVALLAAVVAHASNQAAPTLPDGAAAPPTADPSRDVVQRFGQESTVSLLERCEKLGLAEGRLCRARICSGRWGTDAACH